MSWARLDDGFHDHYKIVGLPLDAVGLFVLSLTWAHRQRAVQLGHIPAGVPQMLAGAKAKRIVAELVDRKLWEVDDEHGGWLIHDFTDYLASDDDGLTAGEKRKRLSAAGKAAAEARWAKRSRANGSATVHAIASESHSDGNAIGMPPTRPDPTTEPNGSVEGPRKRGTRLPDDWTLPDDWAEFASSLGLTRLDVEREAAKFADFWHAKAGRDAAKLDWAGTWRNWARRAAESKLTVVSQPMGYGWRG